MVLLFGLNCSVAECSQCFGHEWAAEFREASGQLRGGFIGRDGNFFLEKHFASVHADIDAHGGYTGNRFAIGDGPLDGSGSTVFGEQRSVRIDPAEFWNIQKAGWNDLAVSDYDDGVGIGFIEEFFGFGSADFFWLDDWEIGG